MQSNNLQVSSICLLLVDYAGTSGRVELIDFFLFIGQIQVEGIVGGCLTLKLLNTALNTFF